MCPLTFEVSCQNKIRCKMFKFLYLTPADLAQFGHSIVFTKLYCTNQSNKCSCGRDRGRGRKREGERELFVCRLDRSKSAQNKLKDVQICCRKKFSLSRIQALQVCYGQQLAEQTYFIAYSFSGLIYYNM